MRLGKKLQLSWTSQPDLKYIPSTDTPSVSASLVGVHPYLHERILETHNDPQSLVSLVMP